MALSSQEIQSLQTEYGNSSPNTQTSTDSSGSSWADDIRNVDTTTPEIHPGTFNDIGVSHYGPLDVLKDTTLGVAKDIGQGVQGVGQGLAQTTAPNSSLLQRGEGLLNAFGAGASTFTNVLGEGIKGAAGLLGTVTPESIKQPVVNNAHSLLQTPAVQAGLAALGKGIEVYQQWKSENPRVAKDLESAVNIASVLPIGTALKEGGILSKTAGEELGGLASSVKSSLVTQGEKKIEKEALDITRPKLSTAEEAAAKAEGRGTTTGLTRKIVIQPNARELEIANASKGIVKKGATFDTNIKNLQNVIDDSVTRVRQGLQDSKAIWNQNELKGEMSKIERPITVRSDKTITNQANNFQRAVLQLADKADKHAVGLLDLRQGFDNLVAKEFPNLYEKEMTPIRQYIRNVRETLNSYAEKKLPEGKLPDGTSFRDELHKQHLLITAIDNIAEKAPKSGTTFLQRLLKEHPGVRGAIRYGAAGAAGVLGLEGLQEVGKVVGGNGGGE